LGEVLFNQNLCLHITQNGKDHGAGHSSMSGVIGNLFVKVVKKVFFGASKVCGRHETAVDV